MRLLDALGEDHIAVVETYEAPVFLGCIHNFDFLTPYSRTQVETH